MALYSACSLGVINTRFRKFGQCQGKIMPLHSIKAVMYFWQKICHPVKPDSTRYDMGKAIKYNFAFCAAGNAGEKETFDKL